MNKLSMLLLASILLLSACIKNNDGGKFTLKGRRVKDCSGVPHANEYIKVTMIDWGFMQKDVYDLGEGVTDSNGNFSIECQNHGSGDLYFNGRGPLLTIPGGNGKMFDLGTIYDQLSQQALLKIVFKSPHTDTFYIGRSAYEDGKIYPASGIHYLPLTKINNGGALFYDQEAGKAYYTGHYSYHYGFGRQRFLNALTDYNGMVTIKNAFKICGAPDTTMITIP